MKEQELYPVTFHKIMQSVNYTIFILSAKDKKFPIYTSPQVGDMIQHVLTGIPNPRPQTSDLINSIFAGLDIHPLQFVLSDIDDAVYFCRLFIEQTVEQNKQILEIDTRPSDGLLLALTHNIPMFCTPKILEKTPSYEG